MCAAADVCESTRLCESTKHRVPDHRRLVGLRCDALSGSDLRLRNSELHSTSLHLKGLFSNELLSSPLHLNESDELHSNERERPKKHRLSVVRGATWPAHAGKPWATSQEWTPTTKECV